MLNLPFLISGYNLIFI